MDHTAPATCTDPATHTDHCADEHDAQQAGHDAHAQHTDCADDHHAAPKADDEHCHDCDDDGQPCES
ncbi:hypothetical protein [Streptomyces sp. CdTB01]|uniref:hypothetical protein n=1 Tax=Streptomyces sp. CdTB01 TaxID=1725411 RepID=UPI00073A5C0E|nr:hypothetical protein [Streptomyces sp. CdTB01]ALV39207.1 hypothetical protein AS200_44700 [Streptomyces sp. CdTB01]